MNDLSPAASIAFLIPAQTAPQAGAAPAQPAFADPISVGSAQPTGNAAAPLAGTVTAQGTVPPASGARPGGGMDMIFWLLPVMLVVMILFSVLSGRKEKKKKQELVSAIKKHDKVQMLGGIIGTVAEVGDDDIVLRVEEGRIRFAKSAVAAVITSAKASGSVESKPESKSDAKHDKHDSKSGAKASV